MKTVIVNSASDPAGNNIHDRLVEDFEFKACEGIYDGFPEYSKDNCVLITSKKQIVFVEDLDQSFFAERYVFISRHVAESGMPSLTVHFAGNFGENEFGGRPRELARFSPSLLKHYFLALNSIKEEIPPGYRLTLEATHHGPTSLEKPVLFVELGSTPQHWKDNDAGHCVAKALVNSLEAKEGFEKCAIGFGGTHYSDKFNKFALDSKFTLGPIVPKYSLESLDSEMMKQLVGKGDQKVTHAALDMKGLSSHKEKVLKLAGQFGLELIKL